MKISYAITVCNEFVEIQNLVRFLLENKRLIGRIKTAEFRIKVK